MPLLGLNSIYKLDFSKLPEFESEIAKNEDPISIKIKSALKGTTLTAHVKKTERMLAIIQPLDNEPISLEDEKTITDCEYSIKFSKEVLKASSGSNPFEIQEAVFDVLGISPQNKKPYPARQYYFKLMKKSGFLVTAPSFVNSSRKHPFKYSPGKITSNHLKTHPHVTTLLIGCGKVAHTYVNSCYFKTPEMHDENSFSIDISAAMGPDIVVDMHHRGFWSAIPSKRLEKVLDHTYGYFLFENDHSIETIREIFRTLKPGGYLQLDHPFHERDINQLEIAGFTIEGETVARKVQL